MQIGSCNVCIPSERLSLGELRCTTSAFQTILLSFLHTRISGKEACFLQSGSEFSICLAKRTSDTVADRACLTGCAAALNSDLEIILIDRLCLDQGLSHDNLQSLKSEVIIDGSSVDGHLALTGVIKTLATEDFLLPVP